MNRFLLPAWRCRPALCAATLVLLAAPAVAAPTFPPAAVRAWQTGALAPDRLQHVSLAFSLGLGTGLLTRSPAAGAGTAMVLGIAKEVLDGRRGRWQKGDLAADAVGAALAVLATAALER
jgi:hypothetical protein